MAREPQIPLFLWVAAAIVVHLTTGETVTKVVELVEERVDVQRFADSVLTHVKREANPVEISLFEAPEEPDEVALERDAADVPPEPETPPEVEEEEGDSPKEEERKPTPPPEQVAPPKPEEPKAEEKKEPEAKKEPEPEAKKEPEKEPVKAATPTPPPPTLELPKRVAIQQHVEDKNQEDNPEAQAMADDANRVKEETRATITASDQNEAQPTPGGDHAGPTADPGDSHVTEVAQSEDRAGNPETAPGDPAHPAREPVDGARASVGQKAVAAAAPPESARSLPAQKGQSARARTSEQTAVPEALVGPNGQPMPAAREALAAVKAQRARPKRLPPVKSRFTGLPMLPSGIDPNLNMQAALTIIGRDQLLALQKADGERRRSTHRGSWHQVGIERWKAAIENYVAAVKPGNQTALNAARSPFGTYLNQIHLRLHPIFADKYLAWLETLPASHPLSDMSIKTNLEIVLSKVDGSVVRMGVTKSSGSTAFDVNALEAVQRASPYGPPPPVIVSPDGNVYLHWEFHRNPDNACSTYFARPYIISPGQHNAPLPPPAKKPDDGAPSEPPRARTGQNDTPKPPARGQRG